MASEFVTNALVSTEEEEQRALFRWIAYAAAGIHKGLKWCAHIANEGKRSPQYGAKLKSMGMRAGFPDICLPVARGGYHSLYIELKRKKGGSLTENQKRWLALLRRLGHYTVYCHGSEEAEKIILWYLNLSD